MNYTSRLNVNRGYMKLEVWREAIVLVRMTAQILKVANVDIRLKSQILGAVQSISSNISEGYCRRTIKEYLQFLNVALGSSGEALTRMIGLVAMETITHTRFDEWDKTHYSMENKLLGLVRSLESKKKDGTWNQELPP